MASIKRNDEHADVEVNDIRKKKKKCHKNKVSWKSHYFKNKFL